MNVEMRYLHTFRAVCEAGSLCAAASVLHRTEQAVSYQLRKLEEALGMAVFQRGHGRLVPNAAGKQLLAFCRDIGRDWEKLHEQLGEAALPGTPLRIAAVSGFGRYQLLPLFREGPLADIPIRLRFPTARDVVRQMETGACDLGFVHRTEVHDRLSHVPVGTEEIVCVASVASAQTRHSWTSLHCVNADYMTYDESNYVFATWFTQIVGMNMTRLNTVAHFEELEEVLDWVAAGRGISIVPAACAADRDDVLALRSAAMTCRNTIYAVRDPTRQHVAIERTLEVVREHAQF